MKVLKTLSADTVRTVVPSAVLGGVNEILETTRWRRAHHSALLKWFDSVDVEPRGDADLEPEESLRNVS